MRIVRPSMLLTANIFESFAKPVIIEHMLLVVSFVVVAHGERKLTKFLSISRLTSLGEFVEPRLRLRLLDQLLVLLAIVRLL